MLINLKRFTPGMVLFFTGALMIGCEGQSSDQQGANSTTPSPEAVVANTPAAATPVTSPQKIAKPPAAQPSFASNSAATTLTQNTPTVVQPIRPPQPTQPLAASTLTITPAVLDLGIIATGDTGVGTVLLTNSGTEALIIERAKASCGCTTAKLVPNTTLAPGETVEMDIRLKGGLVPTSLNKSVTIQVKNQRPVQLQVRAQSVSFVAAEPNTVNPQTNPDGKIIFTSTDGVPFLITSMQPGLIADFPTEPQTEITVNIPYEEWRNQNAAAKLIFYTDHPKCSTIYVTMVRSQADNRKLAANNSKLFPTPPTSQPSLRKDGSRPLRSASTAGIIDPDALIRAGQGEQLLEYIAAGKVSIEATDSKGAGLLSLATRAGNIDLVLGLIDAGAAIETSDRAGMTPLMYASEARDNVEVVRALLDAGAEVNSWGNGNWTAMITGVRSGDPAIVQELLDAGARLDVAQPVTGWTPLFWAVMGSGDPRVIEMLVAAGDQLESEDALEGATPLIRAASTSRSSVLKKLVALGANIEARDRNGKTALLAAASGSGGTAANIQALLESGADIHAKDNRGLTALDFARKRTDISAPAVVDLLEKSMAQEKPSPSETPDEASGQ